MILNNTVSAYGYNWTVFTSSPTGSVTINSTTGFAKAVAAGTATIRYTATGCGNFRASRTITIKAKYTVTASAGTGGNISSAGATALCSGSGQSYTITPNSGYNIADVLVDGVSQGAITSYTFTNITANRTISVIFSANCVATTSTTNESICPSELPYSWNGLTFTAAGSQTKTGLTNAGGCDSTATLNLTVKTNTTSTTNESICPSELPYSWNGLTFTAAGSQTKTGLTNAGGCDSAATLNLTVKTNTTSTTNVNICPSELPYSWNGLTFTAAGSQTAHLTNAGGCDSAATLSVTVKTNTTSTTNVSICPSELPYSWNGLTFTAAGSQTKTGFTNSQGCDRSASLTVTLKATSSSSNSIAINASQLPYSWNGLTFTAAGTQTAHLTNAAGCDSAASLTVSVALPTTPAISGPTAVCVGATISLSANIPGGVWSTPQNSQASINSSTGVLTANYQGGITVNYKVLVNGVSKTASFNVKINAKPAVPTITYTAASNAIRYTFYINGKFCVGKSFSVVGTPNGGSWAYTNAAAGTISPAGLLSIIGAGNGAIVYTYTDANGCSNSRTMAGNTAVCPSARGVSASGEGLVVRSDFTMYPNPAKGLINLNVETLVGVGSVIVTDLYGKQVKTQALSMGTNTVDIANLSKGMYFVSTITNEGKTTKKLVVE